MKRQKDGKMDKSSLTYITTSLAARLIAVRFAIFTLAIPALLLGILALLIGQAGASSTEKSVHGSFEFELITPCSDSPVGLCATGELRGTIHGPAELVVTSISPTSTPGLNLITSTSVVHTNKGDIFLASSAVADQTPGGDGEFTSVDLITGGTGKWAGASGYLQSRGFVVGTTDIGDYRGKIVFP